MTDVDDRTSNDDITQACQDLLPSRFDPDDFEAQLAKLSHC
jgi:hypothetical protein